MVIIRPDSPPIKVRSKIEMDWDINDTVVPRILDASQFDDFQDWADGHCRFVYAPLSEDAKKHTSGWAMRNTNNHNVNILKKSCLGVLVCSVRCQLPNGKHINLRPAICDKARRKQQGKPCPNRSCSGRLEILSCRGHCGYPVTHFWRHTDHGVFFQAKGVHDHPKPEAKGSNETRKSLCGPKKSRSLAVLLARDAALNTKLLTLKYPKKSAVGGRKLKDKPSELIQFNESWTNSSDHQTTLNNNYSQIHSSSLQFIDGQQYSPEYYSPATTNHPYSMRPPPPPLVKTPLSFSDTKSGGPVEQLSPLLTNQQHQMENCNWSSPTNHESGKPVVLTYSDGNNNNASSTWTEFTFVDSIANHNRGDCPAVGNGGPIAGELSGGAATGPEFVNYCEYVQLPASSFPPSISSNASTLSSPTTSTDYNFNYQFDTFNSSLSNDEFDSAYQHQMMDNYHGAYETQQHQEMYSAEPVYQQQHSPESQWTTDISHIPYEPNYYPFASGAEKMIF